MIQTAVLELCDHPSDTRLAINLVSDVIHELKVRSEKTGGDMHCAEGQSVVGTGNKHFGSRKATGLSVDIGRRPLKWAAYHLGCIRHYHV